MHDQMMECTRLLGPRSFDTATSVVESKYSGGFIPKLQNLRDSISQPSHDYLYYKDSSAWY